MGLSRAVAWGVGLAAAVLTLVLAPALASAYLPKTMVQNPVEWGLAAVALIWIGVERTHLRRRERDFIESSSTWLLRRGLFLILAAWTVFRLAAFLPHYPYWPWARDQDSYAVTARSWSLGVLPYRDIRSYNFPGHVYFHWLLGRAFGWGRAGLPYIADAATLLALGGVLLEWSRRRLGGMLPGSLAYFVILAAYFDVPYQIVAQRDWHTTLLAAVALMTMQTWPGRGGRWASAATAAAAFTIRPHLVVFLPAMALAAWQGGDEREIDSWRRRAARVVGWAGAFAVFVAIGFAPLVAAGILDDLLRNLRTASYGGPYSTFSPERALMILREEIATPTTAGAIVALAALSIRGPLRWTARVWLAALGGVIVYRPLHPVDHGYLQMPLKLVTAIAWAVPVAWVVWTAVRANGGLPTSSPLEEEDRPRSGNDRRGFENAPAEVPAPPVAPSSDASGHPPPPGGRGTASIRKAFLGVLAILALMYESVPLREPWNCSLAASLDAVCTWARGGRPSMPPGAYLDFDPYFHPAHPWDDYNGLLRYIRESTGPETVVANIFRRLPLSPVNGPTGRPSPFRADSGICWMWLVRMDLDEEFARQLEASGPDSIVVWEPSVKRVDHRLELPKLIEAVRRDYAPEARFGTLEVWRRKPSTKGTISGTP
ncbi:hypothetical protein [Paludisphaera rhizosphaerae]|uniref:hypothetical protein n=1 Tax=Paludisphaera rhizosphaerae TaxID=2711216 RepID=UPI0013EB39E4|nr:hypothetical protein [Paludisphaera rhizosphaerae]